MFDSLSVPCKPKPSEDRLSSKSIYPPDGRRAETKLHANPRRRRLLVMLAYLVATTMFDLGVEKDRVGVSPSAWNIAYHQQRHWRPCKPLTQRTRRSRTHPKPGRPAFPDTNLPPNLGPGVGVGL
jgi:hypothetical protein